METIGKNARMAASSPIAVANFGKIAMTNNDFFSELLKLTNLRQKPELVQEIFALSGYKVSQSKIRAFRIPISDPRASRMPDILMIGFIQGMFLYKNRMRQQGIEVFSFVPCGFPSILDCEEISTTETA